MVDTQAASAVVLAISDELYGRAVAEFAINHHWTDNTVFHLVHVIEPLAPYIFMSSEIPRQAIQEIIDEQRMFGERLLSDIDKQIHRALPSASVKGNLRDGSAAEQILRLAKETDAKAIVVGSHGRKGIEKFL